MAAAAAAGVLTGIGTELRGTPHNAHILAAVGLNPGGFLFPHTSHSQLSNTSSASCIEEGKFEALLPADKYTVTFGEDLNRPA
jgi:hypothetical protein